MLLLGVACIAMMSGNMSVAKERTWYKYENEHFVAFSNESEKTVVKLLTELEYFRAAVLQFAKLEADKFAPKPNVIIFRTEKEFHKFIGSRDLGGIAINENGALYMITPAGSNSRYNEVILRHEYTHLLVARHNMQYPTWFNEGFAELMAATTFRSKNTVFSVGDTYGRQRTETRLTPWSEIVSDEFKMHEVDDTGRRSDAYLQCWFLVHYFLLGNEGKNRNLLSQYFVRIGTGEDSLQAFEAVVGMSADEFGENVLTEYKMRYGLYDFRGPPIEPIFDKTVLSSEGFNIHVERFRGRYSLFN